MEHKNTQVAPRSLSVRFGRRRRRWEARSRTSHPSSQSGQTKEATAPRAAVEMAEVPRGKQGNHRAAQLFNAIMPSVPSSDLATMKLNRRRPWETNEGVGGNEWQNSAAIKECRGIDSQTRREGERGVQKVGMRSWAKKGGGDGDMINAPRHTAERGLSPRTIVKTAP